MNTKIPNALACTLQRPASTGAPQTESAVRDVALGDLLETVLGRSACPRFRVRGYSMSPFIRDGDLITLAPVARTGPGHGEVVALRRPESGQVVVHRVLNVCGGALRTQGDNLCMPDATLALQAVLGRVVRIEHAGRRISFGLGPERHLVAWLSEAGFLPRLISALGRLRMRRRRRPDSVRCD
jgi:hypothetical protein